MRKINLKLDALSVESFATADATAGTGTVEGHQLSGRPGCFPSRQCPTEYISCEADATYPASCQYGCGCTGGTIVC
jgi:hypothetical protein